MNASGPSKLWSRVLRDYKSRFQTNDLVYFEQFADPKTLARSLSIQASSSSSASSSFSPSSSIFSFKEGSPVLEGLKQFTALLAVFTASIPDVSNIVWGSISLINEVCTPRTSAHNVHYPSLADLTKLTACQHKQQSARPYFSGNRRHFSIHASLQRVRRSVW